MSFHPYVAPPLETEHRISDILPSRAAGPVADPPVCPGVRRLILARARIAEAARLAGAPDPDLYARSLLGRLPRYDPRVLADAAWDTAAAVRIDGWARDPWRATATLIWRSLHP